jgi:DNA primase
MSTEMKSVVEFLADKYLEWWRPTSDGNNISGPCPFHEEKSVGAFYISTVNGMFICHSCQTRGNLATFMKELGASSKLRTSVMDRVGAEITAKVNTELNPRKDALKNHMPLSEGMLGIFDYCPKRLLDAGFDKDVLRRYDIGFDKDQMRITFPIRSHLGVLMGIAGRTVTDEQPRYKIYKEQDFLRFSDRYKGYVFEKKHFLWNMDRVMPEALHGNLDHIFVVEGYKAALWLIQHGAWNTVALQGTYMSRMQQTLLQRTDCSIYILLDNTASAMKGTYEAGLRLNTSHKVGVCCYPEDAVDGAQPDDLNSDELMEVLTTPVRFRSWRKEYGH